jgi:hypothetical protein
VVQFGHEPDLPDTASLAVRNAFIGITRAVTRLQVA